MIPADHWHENGDGTAWLLLDTEPFRLVNAVLEATDYYVNDVRIWDRSCVHCGGSGRCDHDDYDIVCVQCKGTGQYTFTVELNTAILAHPFTTTYRVSVVPDMVLPIRRWFQKGAHVRLRENGRAIYVEVNEQQHRITLPSAAAPGMWAVKLIIHSTIPAFKDDYQKEGVKTMESKFKEGQKVKGKFSGAKYDIVSASPDINGHIILKNQQGRYVMGFENDMTLVEAEENHTALDSVPQIDNHEQRLETLEEEIARQRESYRLMLRRIQKLETFRNKFLNWITPASVHFE